MTQPANKDQRPVISTREHAGKLFQLVSLIPDPALRINALSTLHSILTALLIETGELDTRISDGKDLTSCRNALEAVDTLLSDATSLLGATRVLGQVPQWGEIQNKARVAERILFRIALEKRMYSMSGEFFDHMAATTSGQKSTMVEKT